MKGVANFIRAEVASKLVMGLFALAQERASSVQSSPSCCGQAAKVQLFGSHQTLRSPTNIQINCNINDLKITCNIL